MIQICYQAAYLPCPMWATGIAATDGNHNRNRADSRFEPNQWVTMLLCNNVSHWLGPNLESALRSAQNGCHFVEDISDAFSWLKITIFWFNFHWILFVGVKLTISQYWSEGNRVTFRPILSYCQSDLQEVTASQIQRPSQWPWLNVNPMQKC